MTLRVRGALAHRRLVTEVGGNTARVDVPYYRVRTVEREASASRHSTWRITFSRVGSPGAEIEVTVHSAIFAGLDLDGVFTTEDLMRLRHPSTG